jgi:hypothetical protein
MKTIYFSLCLAMWAAMLWSASAQTLTDIGATAPTPGANDISQLSTSGNQTNPNGLNYYTDNQTGHGTGEPGQTFTTGNNAAGYILSTVSIKTAGLGSYSGISTSQPYYLHIYSVSGGNATVLQTYTSANITFNDGDWLQWSGLSVALSPNATYAYSFGKASSTNGWEALAVATNNPYACGEIGLVPTSGGAITFGSSHGFDAVFDLGLAPALAPVVSLLAVLPMNTVLVGTPVTFTASVAGAQPLYWQWQFNSGSGYANIPGAITNTMGFTAAVTNNGLYQLILTNSYGAVTSAPVTLSVILNPTNEPNNDNVIIYNGQAILSSGWQNWSYGGATGHQHHPKLAIPRHLFPQCQPAQWGHHPIGKRQFDQRHALQRLHVLGEWRDERRTGFESGCQQQRLARDAGQHRAAPGQQLAAIHCHAFRPGHGQCDEPELLLHHQFERQHAAGILSGGHFLDRQSAARHRSCGR